MEFSKTLRMFMFCNLPARNPFELSFHCGGRQSPSLSQPGGLPSWWLEGWPGHPRVLWTGSNSEPLYTFVSKEPTRPASPNDPPCKKIYTIHITLLWLPAEFLWNPCRVQGGISKVLVVGSFWELFIGSHGDSGAAQTTRKCTQNFCSCV